MISQGGGSRVAGRIGGFDMDINGGYVLGKGSIS